MAFYDKFPYTNFQELNLDKIGQKLGDIDRGIEEATAQAEAAAASASASASSAGSSADSATQAGIQAASAATSAGNAAASAQHASEAAASIGNLQAQVDANSARIDQFENLTPGSTTGDAELQDIRISAYGETYTNAGSAVRAQFNQLSGADNAGATAREIGMEPMRAGNRFFYKADTYVDANLQEATLSSGLIMSFKIPIKRNTIVFFTYNPADRFIPSNFSMGFAFRMVTQAGQYAVLSPSFYMNDETRGCVIFNLFNTDQDYTHIFLVTGLTLGSKIFYGVIDPDATDAPHGLLDVKNTVYAPDPDSSIMSSFYAGNSGMQVLSSATGRTIAWFPVHAGDMVTFNQSLPSYAFLGGMITPTYPIGYQIADTFTFPEDGVAYVFMTETMIRNAKVYPADSIHIEYSALENIPPTEANPYDSLLGVAFGTSLTAKSRPGDTGGYLNYLPEYSGITFDNQGVNSGTILPNASTSNMYSPITAYADYSTKDVALLEGFVNDWYYNGAYLGTWKDSGMNTVCGRIRNAINHMRTQNRNLTIFLILDHFGQGITASDAVNSAGMTQYEFYAEIEKLALSMAVRVIREYELSEICEKTPQYLLDNIHLNTLGSQQSAKAIWSGMKDTYPNA